MMAFYEKLNEFKNFNTSKIYESNSSGSFIDF